MGVQLGNLTLEQEVWDGGTQGYYMIDTQTIYPSKKLSQCPNGWVLVWSYFNGTSGTNTNFNLQFIPKFYGQVYGGYGTWLNGIGNGTPTPSYKYIYVYDDHITGNVANNATTGNKLLTLRKVFAI